MKDYYISIHKKCSSWCHLDSFSSEYVKLENKKELDHAKVLCENDRNMASLGKASLVAIRTDFSSLPADLFLPTLIHAAIKAHRTIRVFAILVSIVWDLSTLPIRLFTLLPRAYYNYRTQPHEHPLIPFLRSKGVAPLYLEGKVNILVYEEEHQDQFVLRSGDGYSLYLTDKEIPFKKDNWQFCSRNPSSHKPKEQSA